ncbi:hydrophobic protein [Streptomyces sp. NPDC058475]|uniref:hydrophobic protein n=1 Tax=unclassified Streptomyces TaxID=2593676 RepID=UPI0036638629
MSRRLIPRAPLLLVLLLALLLFGVGFAVKALWWIAVIVLVVWLLGFVARPGASSGRSGRWYRW